MQERSMITNMDLKVYMGKLRNNTRFTEEMLQLVEEDLKFGLTPKETEEYTGKKFDYQQMKIYSKCLRNGYEREAIEIIAKEGLTGEQMAVALEFYEKGVPLSIIKDVTENTGQTAFIMKKLFQSTMEKLKQVQEKADVEGTYASELLGQIKEVVEKITFQEKRYDTLNEKVKELQTAEQDAKVRKNLLSQLTEKDALLEKQQNEINEARAAIARLRNELDEVGKEKQGLEMQIAEMENLKKQKETMGQPSSEEEKTPEKKDYEKATKKRTNDVEEYQANFVGKSAFNVKYQVAVVDKNGMIIQMIPVERTEQRKNNGMLTSLFSKFFYKKKNDIVKLVAEKGLEPKQLIQIRKAIEKGLTEQQIMVLINRQIPAEQMEEIINIAVFENGQKGEA